MSEEMFKRYKIKAKKALGQNFLVNENILDNISHAIDVMDKNIIEVGPGYGALTQKLLEQDLESLTLVELDKRMIEILEDRISLGELETENTNFKMYNTDVLQFNPDHPTSLMTGEIEGGFASGDTEGGLASVKYSVIANIPYYITSPILRHFLYKLEHKPEEMVILMQKDVGDKILEIFKEGKKQKSSVIGLMIAKKASAVELFTVGRENFIPAPNVESSVLLFKTHNLYGDVEDGVFLKYIKIGFAAARKKLVKNFVNGGLDKQKVLQIFEELGINENCRGEELTIEMWCKLITVLEQN